jgi:hypothetical protein
MTEIQALQYGTPVSPDFLHTLNAIKAGVLTRGVPSRVVAQLAATWLGLTARAITDHRNEQRAIQLEFNFLLRRAQDPRLKSYDAAEKVGGGKARTAYKRMARVRRKR